MGIGLTFGHRTRTQWGTKRHPSLNYLFNKRLFQNTSVPFYHDFQYQFRESAGFCLSVAELWIYLRTQIKGSRQKRISSITRRRAVFLNLGWVYFSCFGHLRGTICRVTARYDDAIQRRSVTVRLYAAHEWELQERIAIDYGLHFTQFSALGNGQFHL